MENPFEHFVFGRQSANPGKQSTPSLGTATAAAAAARKSRAHSRSGSISQSISVPAAPVSAPEQPPSMPRSRPTSTHKRHSSVSNRRESAELMGIALPPEDPAKENQAVQDPVLRALLALEGNRSSSSSPRNSFNNRFAKVQIPDFDALDAAEAAPEPRMPALSLNSSLAGKRDSFGKLLTPASSIHMELGTLIEEEEEDEDVVERSLAPTFLALPRPVSAPPAAPTQTLAAAPAPAFVTPPPQPLRARPHNLDLRALTVSTAPNVVQPPTSDSSSIPTPAATPSTRVTGLKSLTLSSSPLISASPSPLTGGAKFGSAISSPAKTLNRKSSISYRRSDDDELSPRSPPPQSIAYGRPSLLSTFLLTPEPTPTSSSPPGTPSEMSPSRRTFIYHSHAALVSRVSELERLLAIGVPTPVSTTSNEFLALIADLKSERDELKRDAQGYLSRISDLEKQNATLSNRIEKERREGWALREQLGGLQIEKTGLQSDHKKLKAANDGLQDQVAALQAQLAQMRNERDDALEASRARPMLKRSSHANPGAFSIDSLSSATDVESIVSQRSSLIAGLNSKLKVVEEEDDRQFYRSAEQRDLKVPRYEDDSDDSFYSRSRPNSACSITLSIEPAKVNHSRHDTLSRTWNFAKASSAPRSERKTAEVDRFFVCLEDQEDTSSVDDDLTMPRSLGGFGGFGGPLDDEDEDDMPPFVLPAQNDQAKFAAAQDTDDEEDDGMSFVIPSSAPAVPASKPVLKPSGLQFSTSLRMPTVPSSRRRQTINASTPTLHADAQASLGSRPALVNAEAGSSGCPNPSRSFTYPLTRHPRPTIPPHERDDLPAVSSSAYPPASLITAATTAARSTTHARISSSSSNPLASPLSSPSTPRQRRPQLDLSPPMLEPLRPLSPLVSRFPSLSSIWGGLISPLASQTPSEPRMASREAQLARLRASMDIGMSHSLCNVPCSNCSTSGSIVHL